MTTNNVEKLLRHLKLKRKLDIWAIHFFWAFVAVNNGYQLSEVVGVDRVEKFQVITSLEVLCDLIMIWCDFYFLIEWLFNQIDYYRAAWWIDCDETTSKTRWDELSVESFLRNDIESSDEFLKIIKLVISDVFDDFIYLLLLTYACGVESLFWFRKIERSK